MGLVEKDDAFFSRFLEDKEVVIYSSIENSNWKLFRLLEFIVEEAGGFVSTDINEGPYIVITEALCLSLEWNRDQCQTHDRHYDVVKPDWLFKCYDCQALLPVAKSDCFIAKYDTKLRWKHKINGNNRYLEARFDFD